MATADQPHDATTTSRGEQVRATRAVMRYLDSLTGGTPPPKTSTRTVETELAKIDTKLAEDGLTSARRLKLLQDRRDLQAHGLPARGRPSGEGLLDGFITHAAAYADTHHISYEAFLDFGVPPEVLDKASIEPTDDATQGPSDP